MSKDIKQDYIQEIKKTEYDVLPDKTIKELIDKAHQGCNESREKVIHSNLRLVVYVINKYVVTPERLWMDCVSEGNIILAKSIDKFKTDTTSKFSTFVAFPLRWYLWSYVSWHENGVRIPDNKAKRMRDKEAVESFQAGMIDTIDKTDQPVSKNYMVPIIDGYEIPDATEPNKALEGMLKEDRSKLLLKCLECLSEKERAVIVVRWLKEGKQKSCRELCQTMGVSHQRVYQIEKVALNKLRLEMLNQKEKENRLIRFDIPLTCTTVGVTNKGKGLCQNIQNKQAI